MNDEQASQICALSMEYANSCYALNQNCIQLVHQKWVLMYPCSAYDDASSMLLTTQKTYNDLIDYICAIGKLCNIK